MDTLCVFNEKFEELIKTDVKTILLENPDGNNTSGENSCEKTWESQSINNMSCSYCQIDFHDVINQREHYKLDWHRFNLKQSLSGKNRLSEEEFNEKTLTDDISSISDTDSDKEDTLDTYATAQGKMFLKNDVGKIFALYKCLVFNKKDKIDESVLVKRLKDCCIVNKQWTIFMLGGGHFAGAIFNNGEAILHKTFHCYTVRQGQGGSQSSRDNKSGSSHPKSAGASLRRYNEQALIQHVQDIVELWKNEIGKSSIIFYRAPGPYNRSVLFGGNNPVLQRTDERLRTIPFSTRTATFTEVKRVYSVLSDIQIYENMDKAVQYMDKHRIQIRDAKKNKLRTTKINRAKSREIIKRPLPTKHSSETNLTNLDSSSNKDETDSNSSLNISDHEISFEHLKEFDETKSPEKNIKKKKPKKSKTKKLNEKETQRKNELISILITGNLIKLKELIDDCVINDIVDELNIKNDLRTNYVNQILDEDGNSFIHIASLNEQVDLVKFLLENDADPTIKNKKLKTPYCCTTNKDVRDVMKDFARDNPDKYNYNKAQIPMNTLTPEELAEKKKIQKKIKKNKEKIKKEENKIKKQEENEKERFLKLSDREKRALAAERRILLQDGKVSSRCFLCASDITGKVPFEYLSNRFCSMECLKCHRLKSLQI